MSVVDAQSLNQKMVLKGRSKYLISVDDSTIALNRKGRPYWIIIAAAAAFIISLFILGIVFLVITVFLIFYYFMQKGTYIFNKETTEIRDTGGRLELSANGRIYTFTKLYVSDELKDQINANNAQDNHKNTLPL